MREKVLGLISGGIDSPVAVCLAARDFKVLPLHFCLYPMSSKESSIKAIDVLRELKSKINFEKAIIFPWAGILEEIRTKVKKDYSCVVCRKSMLITASKIGKLEGAEGIITGESLGQKASQTLENLSATSYNIHMPVLRPLIGMNKDEIIKISKNLGIWKPDHAGCCLVTPQNPKTRAKRKQVDKELEKIEIEGLIEENRSFILETEKLDEDFESYLFELATEFE
ncbi:hypothetical protein AKJ38_03755 [candidate division MSBL1 archaeon SCGC-AAA259I14]|uniref:Thil AANH domain-containing protein n=2 Tax=candidate division MSBL1 TaxID=215777 RepID=A0A133UPQ8_9EURY|nr:hypothetical protein AKJ61_02555 [candidate division MSBL1 archaeon SCGC-AAA259B11]KXA96175.1 hypothetical protein AKJ38_03755 [candidate division MSBL1 archaeon SCGC-AAA259I14]